MQDVKGLMQQPSPAPAAQPDKLNVQKANVSETKTEELNYQQVPTLLSSQLHMAV